MARRLLALLIFTYILTATVGLQSGSPTSAQENTSVGDVASEMYCPCGCAIILATCEETMRCDVAGQVKAEIQALIDRGMSKEQILDVMQERYGTTILANPPKEGFGLTLWTYPLIGLAVGITIIYAVSRRRRDVKWYFDPDEVLELSEEEFAETVGLEPRETSERRVVSERYERLFEEEYRRFKARKGKRSSSPAS